MELFGYCYKRLHLGTGRQPLQLMNSIDIYRPSSVWDTKDVVNNVKAFMELMVDQVISSCCCLLFLLLFHKSG